MLMPHSNDCLCGLRLGAGKISNRPLVVRKLRTIIIDGEKNLVCDRQRILRDGLRDVSEDSVTFENCA